jgi:hypothetical protein
MLLETRLLLEMPLPKTLLPPTQELLLPAPHPLPQVLRASLLGPCCACSRLQLLLWAAPAALPKLLPQPLLLLACWLHGMQQDRLRLQVLHWNPLHMHRQ